MAEQNPKSPQQPASAAMQEALKKYSDAKGKPPMTVQEQLAELDKKNAQDPRFQGYKHYRFGDKTPVRFLVNDKDADDKHDGRYGAEWLNDKGIAVKNVALIRMFSEEDNAGFTRITKEEFDKLVEHYKPLAPIEIAPATKRLHEEHLKTKGRASGGRE